MKAVLKSPALESWESLEAPADVCTPEVAAFALSHCRLCSQEPFQGPLFTLRPPQRPLEALFSKQRWVLMLALIGMA